MDDMIDIQPSEDGTDDASISSDGDGEDNGMEAGDEDMEELAAEAQPEAGPSNPKPKHRDLYAPPTLEELDTLTSSTSTSFNLQLSALLSSTLLPQSPHSSLKDLLTSLHSMINSIPASAKGGVVPKDGIRKLGLPTLSPPEFFPKKVNWTLGYDKPAEVFVGGSWSVAGGYKTGKGEQGGVDMVLVMPEVHTSPSINPKMRCPSY